jgi:hypothetical protein
MTERAMAPRRPGVVTLVGIVLFINAVIAGVASIAVFFNRDAADWQEIYKMSENELLTLAIVEGVLAILLLLVGLGIMSGAKWARLAVGIVMGLRVAALTWYMLTNLGEGAFTWATVISMAFALFVLWALYGNDRSHDFYQGYA